MKKKELFAKVSDLERLIQRQKEVIIDLKHFIRENKVKCQKCGLSGLDCHNYQG